MAAIDVAFSGPIDTALSMPDSIKVAIDNGQLDVTVEGINWVTDGVLTAESPASQVGDSVDPRVRAEILGVVRMGTACENAGDLYRALAVYSDVGLLNWARLLRRLAPELSATDVKSIIARQGVGSLPRDEWQSTGTVIDVRRLAESFAGIIIHEPDDQTIFHVLGLVDGVWRVDQLAEVTNPFGPSMLPTPTSTGNT